METELPHVGFGTYKLTGDTGLDIIAQAIQSGYTLLDTAAYYENEKQVADAIEQASADPQQLTVVTKLWKTDMGYDSARRAIDNSLKNLRKAQLDIYLIHWPAPANLPNREKINAETWRALENAKTEGQIREIGVSNFLNTHLQHLFHTAHHRPFCNEIEFHPGYTQADTVQFCHQHDIRLLGWSPLARGKALQHPAIEQLASKYQKTAGQICLRYSLQKKVTPIPKASSLHRMHENRDILDFQLSEEEVRTLDELPEMGFSGYHPDQV